MRKESEKGWKYVLYVTESICCISEMNTICKSAISQ